MKTKHYDNSSEAVKKWKAELRERVRATNEEKAAAYKKRFDEREKRILERNAQCATK